jgi:2-dehydro-3-deoxyphosphogluconate aldolase/(4S)-4-hydroxy-2-oxoglutarate aldolase
MTQMTTTSTERRSEANVVARLRAARVLPVVTLDRPDQGRAAGRALMAGGIDCVEICFRTDAAVEGIRRATEVDGLLVGAGTVLSPESLEAAVEAGACFGVAPGLNEDVVLCARELGVPFFAGVATPTEIDRARTLGLSTVKVFPASQVGGCAFLRAVSATFPDLGFIPTGGIRSDTVEQYLEIPSVVACGGSWIAPQQLLDDGLQEIERLAREVTGTAS